MKIYTKGGDKGETSLLGGKRVPKYDSRIEAYGSIDELNSQIGCLRTQLSDQHSAILTTIQSDLFTIGSLLAATKEARQKMNLPSLDPSHITMLEKRIDEHVDALPELRSFILPGRTYADGIAHVARCVCRRAERRVVELSDQEENELLNSMIQYLNRLSDYLFVLARVATNEAGHEDLPWNPGS